MNEMTIERLREAWTKDPASLSFVPLAEALRRRGNLDEAIQVSRAGLDHRPNHSSGHLVLGRCLFDKGELSEAIREFEEVVSLDSKNAVALRLLGLALKGKGWGRTPQPPPDTERREAAASGASRYGSEPVGDIEFFTRTMAEVLETQGFYRKALEVYERLAAIYPDRDDLRDRIASVRIEMERAEREGRLPS